MSSLTRQVYIISDLHIGGRYPDGVDPAQGTWPDRNDRGFRICTRVDALAAFVRELAARPPGPPEIELVINGDFVDFLSEEWDGPERWKAFITSPDDAAERMSLLMKRDQVFFDALAELLARGHRLTVLLGNHDVELSFPAVRKRLEGALGVAQGKKFEFLYDGQAYLVGDALIEHGNRYDGFNVTDHDGLRRVRSIQSRRETLPGRWQFRQPPGSKLVAHVMNELKDRFPFVDLLKPEDTAAIPVVLALAPAAYSVLARLGLARDAAALAAEARRHNPSPESQPTHAGDISSAASDLDMDFGGDIAAGDLSAGASRPGGDGTSMDMDMGMDRGLQELLADALGKEQAGQFARQILDAAPAAPAPAGDDIDTDGDISAGSIMSSAVDAARRMGNIGKLLLARESKPLSARIDAVYAGIRAVQNDRSFDRGVETAAAYRTAAEALIARGFKYVVFGHTHLAKRVALGSGVYLNSGTWADLMRFPRDIVEKPAAEARPALEAFVEALDQRRFAQYVEFIPTYVRLDVAGDRVVAGELCDYKAG